MNVLQGGLVLTQGGLGLRHRVGAIVREGPVVGARVQGWPRLSNVISRPNEFMMHSSTGSRQVSSMPH